LNRPSQRSRTTIDQHLAIHLSLGSGLLCHCFQTERKASESGRPMHHHRNGAGLTPKAILKVALLGQFRGAGLKFRGAGAQFGSWHRNSGNRAKKSSGGGMGFLYCPKCGPDNNGGIVSVQAIEQRTNSAKALPSSRIFHDPATWSQETDRFVHFGFESCSGSHSPTTCVLGSNKVGIPDMLFKHPSR